MVVILLAIAVLILGPGYVFWLRFISSCREQDSIWPQDLPSVDVIVPCKDEESLITQKIENTRRLSYPSELKQAWLVDGDSTDGTLEIVKAEAEKDKSLQFLALGVGDKILQLNTALEHCRGKWVLVTDADADLPADTLLKMVTLAETSSQIGVVGTAISPQNACSIERLHWDLSNAVRHIEAQKGSASLAMGPCYLFRREMLPRFEEDVVADDVFVSLTAASQGQRIGFVNIPVAEHRSARTIREFLLHKLRKANAYSQELKRFLSVAYRMPSETRRLFLWKLMQFTLLPILFLGLLGTMAVEFSDSLGAVGVLTGVVIALPFVGFALQERIPGFALLPVLFLLLVGILTANLLLYPFFRQTASYRKVGLPAEG